HPDLLLIEELAEQLRLHREQVAGLRKIHREVDLNRAGEKRQERQQQQPEKRPLRQLAPDARAGDDHPAGAGARLQTAVAAITLIMNRTHSSPTACAKTSSSVGTLGRR